MISPSLGFRMFSMPSSQALKNHDFITFRRVRNWNEWVAHVIKWSCLLAQTRSMTLQPLRSTSWHGQSRFHLITLSSASYKLVLLSIPHMAAKVPLKTNFCEQLSLWKKMNYFKRRANLLCSTWDCWCKRCNRACRLWTNSWSRRSKDTWCRWGRQWERFSSSSQWDSWTLWASKNEKFLQKIRYFAGKKI